MVSWFFASEHTQLLQNRSLPGKKVNWNSGILSRQPSFSSLSRHYAERSSKIGVGDLD